MSARTCCFCCDIKAGVLATAVYHTVKCLVGIIICSQGVMAFYFPTRGFAPWFQAAALGYFLSLVICFNIELVAGICLMFGVIQHKRELITSWIAANIFLLIVYFIMWIIGFALATGDTGILILNCCVGSISLAIHAYAMFVVYSYRGTFAETTENVETGRFTMQTFLSNMPWRNQQQPGQATQHGGYVAQPQGPPPTFEAQQMAPPGTWQAQPHHHPPHQVLPVTEQNTAQQQQRQFPPPPVGGAVVAPPRPMGGPSTAATPSCTTDVPVGVMFAAEGKPTISARLKPSTENIFPGPKYAPLVDVSSDSEK